MAIAVQPSRTTSENSPSSRTQDIDVNNIRCPLRSKKSSPPLTYTSFYVTHKPYVLVCPCVCMYVCMCAYECVYEKHRGLHPIK